MGIMLDPSHIFMVVQPIHPSRKRSSTRSSQSMGSTIPLRSHLKPPVHWKDFLGSGHPTSWRKWVNWMILATFWVVIPLKMLRECWWTSGANTGKSFPNMRSLLNLTWGWKTWRNAFLSTFMETKGFPIRKMGYWCCHSRVPLVMGAPKEEKRFKRITVPWGKGFL